MRPAPAPRGGDGRKAPGLRLPPGRTGRGKEDSGVSAWGKEGPEGEGEGSGCCLRAGAVALSRAVGWQRGASPPRRAVPSVPRARTGCPRPRGPVMGIPVPCKCKTPAGLAAPPSSSARPTPGAGKAVPGPAALSWQRDAGLDGTGCAAPGRSWAQPSRDVGTAAVAAPVWPRCLESPRQVPACPKAEKAADTSTGAVPVSGQPQAGPHMFPEPNWPLSPQCRWNLGITTHNCGSLKACGTQRAEVLPPPLPGQGEAVGERQGKGSAPFCQKASAPSETLSNRLCRRRQGDSWQRCWHLPPSPGPRSLPDAGSTPWQPQPLLRGFHSRLRQGRRWHQCEPRPPSTHRQPPAPAAPAHPLPPAGVSVQGSSSHTRRRRCPTSRGTIHTSVPSGSTRRPGPAGEGEAAGGAGEGPREGTGFTGRVGDMVSGEGGGGVVCWGRDYRALGEARAGGGSLARSGRVCRVVSRGTG